MWHCFSIRISCQPSAVILEKSQLYSEPAQKMMPGSYYQVLSRCAEPENFMRRQKILLGVWQKQVCLILPVRSFWSNLFNLMKYSKVLHFSLSKLGSFADKIGCLCKYKKNPLKQNVISVQASEIWNSISA